MTPALPWEVVTPLPAINDPWLSWFPIPNAISGPLHPFEVANVNLAALVSQQLYVVGGHIIPAGKTVSSITFQSGATAMVTPSNQWFSIHHRDTRVLLGQTTDDLTNAWANNTLKTLNLVTPYRALADTPVYVGCMVNAVTVPSLRGFQGLAIGMQNAPITVGNADAGLTTTAPNPMIVPVVSQFVPLSILA